ncbi:hypothetical protein ACFTWS_05960 [Streptomyces sp. NPDC057027]|uniref:hypothetical protein n=1 Tax=Streptomyces sp. NPDC057027 TaxID=3346004 RepID=UPI0036285768
MAGIGGGGREPQSQATGRGSVVVVRTGLFALTRRLAPKHGFLARARRPIGFGGQASWNGFSRRSSAWRVPAGTRGTGVRI